MEKAIVMGCVCVVVSSFTPEEIERFEQYNPDALKLEGSDFSIQIDDGPGSLNDDCATFSRATTAEGKATITILLDPDTDDRIALVKNQVGAALLKLEQLEKQMAGKREKVDAMENKAGALITVM